MSSSANQESTVKPLRNDCFALPPGVNWTPVDEALERLRSRLHPVVGIERDVPLLQLNGRILATDVFAPRAHPPSNNSAVDGYAFAGPLTEVPCALPPVNPIVNRFPQAMPSASSPAQSCRQAQTQ